MTVSPMARQPAPGPEVAAGADESHRNRAVDQRQPVDLSARVCGHSGGRPVRVFDRRLRRDDRGGKHVQLET